MNFAIRLLALTVALVVALPAYAQTSSEKTPPIPYDWKVGPSTIALGHDLTMSLPATHALLGPSQAKDLMEKNGTFHNENLLGLVAGADEAADWLVTIRYEEDGYIKDDEALDAAAILGSIREGTAEANKERVEKGFHALTVDGWRQMPAYQRGPHHLVWALDVSSVKGKSANFSTRVLGRKGYVSLNLVSSPERIDANKSQVALLLAATTFDSGSRYEDFKASTDKVAEYGLAGLVIGGAGVAALKVAKVGIFAAFWKPILAFVLAAKKLVIVGLAGIAAALRKWFTRSKPPADSSP